MRSHNPYFNRWFSAMISTDSTRKNGKKGHNPYFNRWFSAMSFPTDVFCFDVFVTILILIDGFLQ